LTLVKGGTVVVKSVKQKVKKIIVEYSVKNSIKKATVSKDVAEGITILKKNLLKAGSYMRRRGIEGELEVFEKIGYDKLKCVHCAIKVGGRNRFPDTILNVSKKIINKTTGESVTCNVGDIVEVKNWFSSKSLLMTLSEKNDVLNQLIDYSKYVGKGNVCLVFKNKLDAKIINEIGTKLRRLKANNIKIINGAEF
jgi:hypothetical protein